MDTIVNKFGGSLLRYENFDKIVQILECFNNNHVIAVVSAINGVTDLLDSLFHTKNKEKFEELKNLHFKLIDLINSKKIKKEIEFLYNFYFSQLSFFIFNKANSKLLYQKILSYGEKLSSIFLYKLLQDRNKEVELLEPENIPLITDGQFNKGIIYLQFCGKIEPSKKFTVIPGFYGITKNKDINLLGRNGTDYTAVAVAYLSRSEEVYFWKDVDGFCSIDPKLGFEYENISHLSYFEADKLIQSGAWILHKNAINIAKRKKIILKICNFFNFNGKIKVSTEISNFKNTLKRAIIISENLKNFVYSKYNNLNLNNSDLKFLKNKALLLTFFTNKDKDYHGELLLKIFSELDRPYAVFIGKRGKRFKFLIEKESLKSFIKIIQKAI